MINDVIAIGMVLVLLWFVTALPFILVKLEEWSVKRELKDED